MLVLFLLLSILEDIGYMARVAFVMDRIFRQFGLSGKSFIPMLVATGCGIPGNLYHQLLTNYTGIAGYSFMVFSMLCAPCFAAIGAIRREMNNTKWTLGAVGYMCAWAYVMALICYNLIGLAFGVSFSIWTAAAIIALAALIYLTARKNPYDENNLRAASRKAA